MTVRTRWMFGFQRRFVRRWECEMLWPKPGPFLQTSQLAATVISWGIRTDWGTRTEARMRVPRGTPRLSHPSRPDRADPNREGKDGQIRPAGAEVTFVIRVSSRPMGDE